MLLSKVDKVLEELGVVVKEEMEFGKWKSCK